MNGKNVGVVAALVVVLGLGGWFAKSKGLLPGGTPEAGEGAEGSTKGKRTPREATGKDGEREGAAEQGAVDKRDAEPDPEYGTYEYKYRTAKAELEMARHDLENYKQTSRWPESARPAEEMAPGGGLLPHYTSPTVVPLVKRRADGTPDPDSLGKARVVLSQDRFQLSGDESVLVSIKGLNDKGRDLPVRCSEARAIAIPAPGADRLPPFPLNCKPGADGAAIATFTPKQSTLRGFTGSIDLDFDLSLERDDGVQETGSARVVVHYVPQQPGRLTGVVREAYENGSIVYYLGLEAAAPGFYRLNVRADNGTDDKIFAHMNVRQNVDKAGPTELRAELFGKLIVDNDVRTVRLRDVDGEFVPEAGEIAGIPGKDGVFYVTKSVDRARVKGDDWSSPEKDEHMKHYEDMLKRAQDDCDKNYDGCKK
jgi:hypothetical protein